ncbi:MAG: mechanosensitive ion channel family protein [Thermoanaerobaculales bacterium]|nr:mechanosensitive ion channel family protein [Thermoanaerobaculales bacterium]
MATTYIRRPKFKNSMILPTRWVMVAGILLCISWGGASAQIPVSVQEEPAPPVVSMVVVPIQYASAQGTMGVFLNAFYENDGPDLDMAAACLDLTQLPLSVRKGRGRELAVQLKNILDRVELIDIESLSGDPKAAPWTLSVADVGQIELAQSADRRWRFTRETVEKLDQFTAAVEDLETVEGVSQTLEPVSPAGWLRARVPASLKGRTLYLEGWQWIGILFLVIAGVIVDRFVVAVLQGPVLLWLRRLAPEVDHDLVRSSLRPLGALAMVLMWWFGLSWLGLPLNVLRWYASLVELVLIFTASLTAYRLVNVLSNVLEKRAQKTENRFDDLLIPLIRKSLKILIFVIAAVLLAETFERDFTGILAGLGIGGLALALAAQDTIGNLFGSLTVLLDRPFQVGDWVVVGDVEGTVEEVGFRSTRIRTFYNSRITLPNSRLTSAAVDNLGDRTYRRWSTRLGIAYDTSPEKIDAFCEGIREIIRRHPSTRKDYFHVYLNEFGASSLEILLYVFFMTPDWATELRERHRLSVDMIRLAAELGVEFAFPTQTLYLRKEERGTSGSGGNNYDQATETGFANARETARNLTRRWAEDAPPPPVDFDEED